MRVLARMCMWRDAGIQSTGGECVWADTHPHIQNTGQKQQQQQPPASVQQSSQASSSRMLMMSSTNTDTGTWGSMENASSWGPPQPTTGNWNSAYSAMWGDYEDLKDRCTFITWAVTKSSLAMHPRCQVHRLRNVMALITRYARSPEVVVSPSVGAAAPLSPDSRDPPEGGAGGPPAHNDAHSAPAGNSSAPSTSQSPQPAAPSTTGPPSDALVVTIDGTTFCAHAAVVKVILDTGASRHTDFRELLFKNLRPAPAIALHGISGKPVHINKQGNLFSFSCKPGDAFYARV